MCGIWAFIVQKGSKLDYSSFMKISHRGPDYTSLSRISTKTHDCYLGFHRLAIMDVTPKGNQPFYHVRPDGSYVYVICNGEIYDHKKLAQDYDISMQSGSDCEIIIPLYERLGPQFIKLLGSEFVCILIDVHTDGSFRVLAGRDPIGVRPLFYGWDGSRLAFSSELKGLSNLFEHVNVFPPGHYSIYENNNFNTIPYYEVPTHTLIQDTSLDNVYAKIRELLIHAVHQRLCTDRPFGCLLSGGLDSSLIVGIVKMLQPELKFPVFTIGFKISPNSEEPPDIKYAKLVASELNLSHHVIEVDFKTALEAIDETIYCTETWDITTIRASVMQRLVAKYIAENTNVKVLLVGENSDELFLGYLYEKYAPNAKVAHEDSIRLIRDVHRFDGLRTDRCMAYHGLEVRLPYADTNLIDYVLSLNPDYVVPEKGMEKALLRKAFQSLHLIPESVLFRTKNAFSDAVSTMENSWYCVLQKYFNVIINDEEFNAYLSTRTSSDMPYTKESYYYMRKFKEYFGNNQHVIPYYWMPKFTQETNDPSARTLKIYNE